MTQSAHHTTAQELCLAAIQEAWTRLLHESEGRPHEGSGFYVVQLAIWRQAMGQMMGAAREARLWAQATPCAVCDARTTLEEMQEGCADLEDVEDAILRLADLEMAAQRMRALQPPHPPAFEQNRAVPPKEQP